MLAGLDLSTIALLLLAGIALDLLLGEVRRWHPLVGFGVLANAIERKLNKGRSRYLRGSFGWLAAVLPLVALMQYILQASISVDEWLGLGLHAGLLYFSVGLRSLYDHTAPIAQALQQGDLPMARELTSRIVSRDTKNAEEDDLAKASVESLLENGNDAVFGTMFWFIVAGGAGAVLFRLANTLDAMWGYRSARYLQFGFSAARIDDVLNWFPARLTALSYALLGNTRLAWSCWQTQAPQWSSPNAGPVMASGAGALGLALGGAAIYDGKVENRPPLGSGKAAGADDIGRAWRLVLGTTALWIGLIGMAALAAVVMNGAAHA